MELVVDASTIIPVVCGVIGGFIAGWLAAYSVCKYYVRKFAKARAARLAHKKAARNRIKREQKFCHNWVETMELGAKNWGLQ